MPRQDTKLESEGAEFLALGQLLIHGIVAHKTYTNMPGYDLIATHPEKNTSARIQVKSRWRTGAPQFIIKNFDCDFVAVVRLNRGKKGGGGEVKPPEYFVMPVDDLLEAVPRNAWGVVRFKDIPKLESYRDRWDLIRDFLAPRSRKRRSSKEGVYTCRK